MLITLQEYVPDLPPVGTFALASLTDEHYHEQVSEQFRLLAQAQQRLADTHIIYLNYKLIVENIRAERLPTIIKQYMEESAGKAPTDTKLELLMAGDEPIQVRSVNMLNAQQEYESWKARVELLTMLLGYQQTMLRTSTSWFASSIGNGRLPFQPPERDI